MRRAGSEQGRRRRRKGSEEEGEGERESGRRRRRERGRTDAKAGEVVALREDRGEQPCSLLPDPVVRCPPRARRQHQATRKRCQRAEEGRGPRSSA
eukprot:754623-Rhodomonas_salina.1